MAGPKTQMPEKNLREVAIRTSEGESVPTLTLKLNRVGAERKETAVRAVESYDIEGAYVVEPDEKLIGCVTRTPKVRNPTLTLRISTTKEEKSDAKESTGTITVRELPKRCEWWYRSYYVGFAPLQEMPTFQVETKYGTMYTNSAEAALILDSRSPICSFEAEVDRIVHRGW
jgi:hypothetical protein